MIVQGILGNQGRNGHPGDIDGAALVNPDAFTGEIVQPEQKGKYKKGPKKNQFAGSVFRYGEQFFQGSAERIINHHEFTPVFLSISGNVE
jgi:hypothetical protein